VSEPHHADPLRRAVRDSVGLGVAVSSYGVSFGALAVAAGLSPAQTCALSLLAFTGGSQFAYVGVIAGGGTAVSASVTALLLGLRNTLYAVRLAPLLRVRGARRLLAAHTVIDESTAMALAQPVDRPDAGRLAFTVTSAVVFTGWNAATLLGALVGHAVDPLRLGLDGAEPAAFLALLWPRLRAQATGGQDRRVGLVAVVLAAAGTIVLPGGLAVPVAALAVLAAGRGRAT